MDNEDFIEDVELDSNVSTSKSIYLELLRRITIMSCCELRGGYYTWFKSKDGTEKETYVQDTREALENGIYCLAQLLMIKFDKEMKKAFEEFETDGSKLKKEFLDKTSIEETEVLGEAYYQEGKEKQLFEEYKIKKLLLSKKLFTQMTNFLGRENYFEIGTQTF